MISKRLLTKKVHTTRARRFRIRNVQKIYSKLTLAQKALALYFNYGLKYLYQHYGVAHLRDYFPSGKARKQLVDKIIHFARHKAKQHKFNLTKIKFNMQSVQKMLESLCVNFLKYRRGQYKAINYWSKKEQKHYLKLHNCNLTGYGRISFKHHLSDVRSFTFKQNHNEIRLINNYCLHIPYFGNIQTYKSLSYAKHKKIVEVRIKIRRPNDYELQIITKMTNQKHLTRKQANNIHGLDVNSKDDKFFALSNKEFISWPPYIKRRYERYDLKAHQLQHYITVHNHGNDNSRETKLIELRLNRIKAKCTHMIDNWQLSIIHMFVRKYPVLAMEQLTSFTMRISKRDKRYRLRKNTNHKLATIHPTRFRKMMEIIYQDYEGLLLEVDPAYTSKTCHNDDMINFKLGLQKLWYCIHCHKWIHRDYNSTLNIRDWAVNPTHHALWKLHKKYPKKYKDVNLKDLVIAF